MIEALLFLENRPVSIGYIEKIVGKSREEIQRHISQIVEKYARIGSAISITQNETSHFQMIIHPHLYEHLAKYYDSRKRMRLSSQALETLAIIAYKQPITRIEIEKIRGVQVGYIIRILLEHKLIKILGRKDVPGRPVLYGTTDTFLKFFGLLSLKDLPPVSEFEKI
jgi:segregation and condensation protein B